MKDKDVNINVVRSVWRRTKKGHIEARDLKPQKDVKGGGGVAGFMRAPGSIAEAPPQIAHNRPLSSYDIPRWLHQLRAGRDAMIRKLFEIPAEPERKAQAERIAKARRVFLRWLKKSKK
ncbi:MAG: hypothetical protein DMF31_00845 [Verrucomicrobia bacterium]|nr:MAG: hypothetical protein DMF31_00845 [Verrucomicrobiota bacterium]